MKTRGRPSKQIILPDSERNKLERLINSQKIEKRLSIRARIIFYVAEGMSNKRISETVQCSLFTVSKWKKRWINRPQIEVLNDLPRSGKPARILLHQRLVLLKLACERPDKRKTPFREIHTQQSLADTFRHETGIEISRSEVQRILNNYTLRPHLVQMWLNTQDPKFYEKAKDVSNIYLNPPVNSVVLSIDEKPMQAISRKYETFIDSKTGISRREYEYKRNGTRCLISSFNVQTGVVHGWVLENRKAATLLTFMHSLVDYYPGKEIHVVWDNLNIHHEGKSSRWTEFNKIHGGRIHFHYTPIHASWLNQIECWFSILERRVLKNGSFASCEILENEVEGFIEYWNNYLAHPFNWTFRPRKDKNNFRKIA
ncbi:IS630 family transposase [Candidatus Dependentiae bacterium]|nr:IS630 family transposase [Candidatus Dependentiae bacterium]